MSALGVFIVAVVVVVALRLTSGDPSSSDQLASVIGLFVGVASLLVSVIGVVQGARQGSPGTTGAAPASIQQPGTPVPSPERMFADELRNLVEAAGVGDVGELRSRLRAEHPRVPWWQVRRLDAVLDGRRRPSWELAAAVIAVGVTRADRDNVSLSSDQRDVQRWRSRYNELFPPRRVDRHRLVIGAAAFFAALVAVPILIVAVRGVGGSEPPAHSGGTALPADAASGVTDPIVTSIVEVPEICAGGYLATQSGVGEPPSAGNRDEWIAWAESSGTPKAMRTHLQFTVRGRTGAAVVLTRVRVRAVKRDVAPAGRWIHAGCGGENHFRWFEVDLDQDPPRVMADYDKDWADVDGPPARREPIRFPYKVSVDDAESFEVFAGTRSCDCLWQIELDWNSGEAHGTHVIGESGKPSQFRTVGIANATVECVDSFDVCTPVTR